MRWRPINRETEDATEVPTDYLSCPLCSKYNFEAHDAECPLDAAWRVADVVLRAQEPPQAQWQPIETAPKDEYRSVLGCDIGSGPNDWEIRTTHFDAGGWVKDTPYAMSTHYWEPTHWMPLPTAPVGDTPVSAERST